MTALAILRCCGPVTASELADRLDVTLADAAGQLGDLRARGLATLVAFADPERPRPALATYDVTSLGRTVFAGGCREDDARRYLDSLCLGNGRSVLR